MFHWAARCHFGAFIRVTLLLTMIQSHAYAQGGINAQPDPNPEIPLPAWVTPPEKVILPPATAAISPNGLRAAWAAADQKDLLTATRGSAGSPWAAPQRLLTIRGAIHKIVFSPDGLRIAYENERSWKGNGAPDDHWEFICVYDMPTAQISYVDPSFNFDTDPSWSGDGKEIAFTRKVMGRPDERLTRPVVQLKHGAWTPPERRADERFTIAQILGAPFVYPPGSSGDGMALAFVTREAKSRNLYFMQIDNHARLLASYSGDDGQELAEPPALSRTGAAVAYVRGGAVNRQGDAPNPTAMPDPPKQDIWIIGTKGKDLPRLLAEGHDPMFTADDRYVLWRDHDNVMAASLSWNKGRLLGIGEPEEFLTGRRESLVFSPDGEKVAYQRGDGVEIYDFASKIAVVIPHGDDVDQGPVWSSDGRTIAFRREPANAQDLVRNACGSERYCGPVVSTTPWAIWTVSVSDLLHPRRIWQANPGVGSVFYPLDQSYSPATRGAELLWSKLGKIIFPWEGDGWRHLYAVPAEGGDVKLLTPGDGEVETAALTRDGRAVVYATNIGDLGRRHISEVSLDNRSVRRLTAGEKDQWSPIPLAGGNLAYVNAGWDEPPKVVVRSANGNTRAAEFPKAPSNFPSALLVKPQLVSFPAADGQTAYGQLFVPAHSDGCGILFSHGGIRRQMLPGFHYMDAYAYLYEMNQYLASRGCVVLSVEYRSSIMRGEAFRDAPGWGFAGNSELRDFVGAAEWLKSHEQVDPNRIGVYGLSWGGYMTAELLAQHSDIFKAGFDMAGVHDSADPSYAKNGALAHLSSWTSPIFLAQGDDDMNVDFNQGTLLARALQAQRPSVELRQEAFPGQTHEIFLTFEQLVSLYAEGSDWIVDHLKAK